MSPSTTVLDSSILAKLARKVLQISSRLDQLCVIGAEKMDSPLRVVGVEAVAQTAS